MSSINQHINLTSTVSPNRRWVGSLAVSSAVVGRYVTLYFLIRCVPTHCHIGYCLPCLALTRVVSAFVLKQHVLYYRLAALVKNTS